MNEKELSPLLLAYLGDAVLEVLVRERLIREEKDTGACTRAALAYITASSQAAAVKRARPHFTPEEEEIFLHARNAKSHSAPRNTDLYTYRLATGLEAVFGMLRLRGDRERMEALFRLAYFPEEAEKEEMQP
ncbi:MAG: ribonuclease III [Clostridia bacterium]|nr:ribonuclease III [Clostridia bacterium]